VEVLHERRCSVQVSNGRVGQEQKENLETLEEGQCERISYQSQLESGGAVMQQMTHQRIPELTNLHDSQARVQVGSSCEEQWQKNSLQRFEEVQCEGMYNQITNSMPLTDQPVQPNAPAWAECDISESVFAEHISAITEKDLPVIITRFPFPPVQKLGRVRVDT